MELMVKRGFDAAHRLMYHPSRCKNAHGHFFNIEVRISGPIDKKTGMVMDFSLIKKILDPIIDEFDHSFILNKEDTKFILFLKKEGMRIVIIDGEPTAENMCFEFAKRLRAAGLKHPYVTIYETATNSCGGN